ncbi:MAG: glycosyltransferase family 4 protein [Deltaproteobacteria bacterium]|nr:glycosyltransferase family 4 protein [Deltaproteobacteria bacterium]
MGWTILLDGDAAAPQQARLGAALASRGHRVIVLDAPRVADQIRGEFHGQCEELRAPPPWIPPLRAFWLRRQVQRLGVDIVHLNFIRPKQRVWADMPGGPPYIATAWGSDLNRDVFKRSARYEAAVNAILQGSSAITADSWPLLRLAEQRLGLRKPPMELVLWSVDMAAFDRQLVQPLADRFRGELKIPPGAKVLLSPRQPKPHYHIERIVQAFAQSKWARQGVLVQKLHGREGEDSYLQDVQALARRLGVQDRLILAPRLAYDELAGLYAMADAAISVPMADGVPSTFLELMALQVPIIAGDLPAYHGVLVHGERALLAPPDDPTALALALDRLVDEPLLSTSLAANAKRWADEHASWSHAVDQWLGHYQVAIGDRGSGAQGRSNPP